jgi:hypothetical protein
MISAQTYHLDGNFTRIRRNNQTGVGLRPHLNLSYSAGTNKISQMEDPKLFDLPDSIGASFNFSYIETSIKGTSN